MFLFVFIIFLFLFILKSLIINAPIITIIIPKIFITDIGILKIKTDKPYVNIAWVLKITIDNPGFLDSAIDLLSSIRLNSQNDPPFNIMFLGNFIFFIKIYIKHNIEDSNKK